MQFKDNPYYNPEKCGLEIFVQINTGGCYAFDMFIIWKKLDDNTLYWDTDAGCSCPSPFDNGDHGHNLKPITKDTFFNFEEALKNHYNIKEQEVIDTKNKVKTFLKDTKQL